MRDATVATAQRIGQEQYSAVPFLENWPKPPARSRADYPEECDMLEVTKWRLQMLLAVNPFGIPSLAFNEAYKRMFGRELDPNEIGFDHLSEMICKMSDIFAVQEPDQTTAQLFPEYPNDRILHDVRLGHDFSKPNMDGGYSGGYLLGDHNDLIHRAWVERDVDFPEDVVLDSEPYLEIFPMTLATVPGTRGLYHGTIVGTASPESVFIRLKASDMEGVRKMSTEIAEFFQKNQKRIDAYSVPKEFIYPGFPCLSYVGKDKTWERCLIVGRSSNKVLVESVDYGGVYAVSPLYLYLIPSKFFELPRQTLKVTLPGLKPTNGGSKWPKKIGSRMRCFSYANYWLEILLVERKVLAANDPRTHRKFASSTVSAQQQNENHLTVAGDSDTSAGQQDDDSTNRSQILPIMKLEAKFDAFIVDRNDDEMDLYLDEILVMETYADMDENKVEEIATMKGKLRDALKNVPRPINPFSNSDKEFEQTTTPTAS